jgi:hypothetical protein
LAVNFSAALYAVQQDTFGRPVVFSGTGYSGSNRGIYDSNKLETVMDEGNVIVEQQTILDILDTDYPTLPVQGDTVAIPADPASGLPDLGSFQITKVTDNGGGEITLQLRELMTAP